jgi:hypothetical protein
MRITHSLALAGLGLPLAPAAAAGLDVTVTIPKLSVAEYHKPYVAIWIEQPGQPGIRTVALWYDGDNRENRGTKWLADLRAWWRKGGREQQVPIAGVSGPTRAPGPQTVSVPPRVLAGLQPGQYELVVEAAREVGGREMLRLPFAWPAKGRPQTLSARGASELTAVQAIVKP